MVSDSQGEAVANGLEISAGDIHAAVVRAGLAFDSRAIVRSPRALDRLIAARHDSGDEGFQRAVGLGCAIEGETAADSRGITVTQGTLTFYGYNDPTCTAHVYSKGQGFVDTGDGHIGFNRTDQPASDVAVAIAPVGGAFRTELSAPNPYCGF